MEFLTDKERDKIIKFNQDTELVEAVKKVMLKALYTQGTLRQGVTPNPLNNAALATAFADINGSRISNEQLGADLRGFAHGLNLLESGFQELAKVEPKIFELMEEETNPAI